jgi:hypothetical protein
MKGKYPHRIVLRISNHTYQILQEELDRRNSSNIEKLARNIIDRYVKEIDRQFLIESAFNTESAIDNLKNVFGKINE